MVVLRIILVILYIDPAQSNGLLDSCMIAVLFRFRVRTPRPSKKVISNVTGSEFYSFVEDIFCQLA